MLLYYIQTNIFCIILFLILFLDVTRRTATKGQKILYFFMLDEDKKELEKAQD